MSDNRKHYLVAPDSQLYEKIQRVIADREAFCAEAMKLREEFGASAVWTTGPFITGMSFEGTAPEGWRPAEAGSRKWVPNLRTSAGKAIRERIAQIRDIDGFSLGGRLGIEPYRDENGTTVHFPGYEVLGDNIVLSVHQECNAEPQGCHLLKMSEYWAMKETAEEKKEVAA